MSIFGEWWPLSDEQSLQDAADNGGLVEGHYLDIKREIKPGDSGNKEAAKDIASFAVDGGLLIYGVDENRDPSSAGAPQLAPMPLANQAERLDGITRTRIDPPLSVRITPIHAAANDGTGYLLVLVPKSPVAPHMVDYKYYGRDAVTKRPLANTEVERHKSMRRASESEAILIAQNELSKAFKRRHSVGMPMIVIVAEPVGADDELLAGLTGAGEHAHTELWAMDKAARVPEHEAPQGVAGGSQVRRSRAVALCSGMTNGQFFFVLCRARVP